MKSQWFRNLYINAHQLPVVCKMATVDDDDVLDDEQLDVLLKFPPDIQEVIDQVLT